MLSPFPSRDTPAHRYARLLRCARCSAALESLLAAGALLLLRDIGLTPALSVGEGTDLTVIPAFPHPEAPPSFTPPTLETPPAPDPPLPSPAIALSADLPEPALDTAPEGEPWLPLPEADLEVEDKAPTPRRLALQRSAPAPSAKVEVSPPSYLSSPEPPYPAALRQRRIEGSVRVRISVSAEGHPTAVSIAESSGYGEFDRAVLSWIPSHWRFHPAMRGDTAVSACVTTRITFCLR